MASFESGSRRWGRGRLSARGGPDSLVAWVIERICRWPLLAPIVGVGACNSAGTVAVALFSAPVTTSHGTSLPLKHERRDGLE